VALQRISETEFIITNGHDYLSVIEHKSLLSRIAFLLNQWLVHLNPAIKSGCSLWWVMCRSQLVNVFLWIKIRLCLKGKPCV